MIQSKAFHVIHYTSQRNLPDSMQSWIRSSKTQAGVHSTRFGDKTYYLIALGSRPTSGYRIEIEKVEDTESELHIFLKEIRPDPTGFYNPVISYPYLLATANRPIEVNWLI